MKSSVAITLIIVGGLLAAGPMFISQRQLQRAAVFYEQQGSGSVLPEAIRPQPHSRYDWGCLAVGAMLALRGAFTSAFSRRTANSPQECSSIHSQPRQLAVN